MMMHSLRRATPDSEAVASSEDERPWPTAPVFGSLGRKENGVPGIGGSIWSTQTKKRGSFTMEKTARGNAANAAREALLSANAQAAGSLRTANTPSPAASEGSGAFPFQIPLQPAPKAGRSLSHSHGQRELLHTTLPRPGGVEHPPNIPLGLLTEEDVDTETESELGGALTHTTSHPPIGTLHRTSTLPLAFDGYSPTRGITGEVGGRAGGSRVGSIADRAVESSHGSGSQDASSRRLWESHLGWDDVPNVNESRRHSLADIPTRRGSLNGAGHALPSHPGASSYWPGSNEVFNIGHGDQGGNERLFHDGPLYTAQTDAARGVSTETANMKYNDTDETGQPLNMPSMYKVPFVELEESERSEADKRAQSDIHNNPHMGQGNRARKQLFIVSFKCSRVDVFFLLENTGLHIKEGDIVIVEADRGQDLGTVQHANVSPEHARTYKRKYGEEQYKWLMMFSRNNAQGNVNPNAKVFAENQAARGGVVSNVPPAMQGLPRDSFNNLKPKAVKRLANAHEIRMLGEKEGNEAKAKRTCQQKVSNLHLDMEILDAEWQWDFQKLIFYYYADHYINFKDLITELYRIYKTRIWLSAINPASFSQHAHGQPPSGIGPGAITQNQQTNSSYTMAYGADPDPYGAIPPYRIGYDTYTPNYPGIPGVANSFAPTAYGAGNGGVTPAVAPGVTATGTMADYNFYYNRGANEDQGLEGAHTGPTALHRAAQAAAGPPPGYYVSPTAAPAGHYPSVMDSRAFAFAPAASSARSTMAPNPVGTRVPSNDAGGQPTSPLGGFPGIFSGGTGSDKRTFSNRATGSGVGGGGVVVGGGGLGASIGAPGQQARDIPLSFGSFGAFTRPAGAFAPPASAASSAAPGRPSMSRGSEQQGGESGAVLHNYLQGLAVKDEREEDGAHVQR